MLKNKDKAGADARFNDGHQCAVNACKPGETGKRATRSDEFLHQN